MTPAQGQMDARSLGWLTSVGLHAALAFGALIFTQRITLAPQLPAFTWRVAMVAGPSDSPQPSSSASASVHAPLRTSARKMPAVRDSTQPAAVSSAEAVAAASPADPTPVENNMRWQPVPGDHMTSPQPPAPSFAQSPVQRPEPPADSLQAAQGELSTSREAGSSAQMPTVASVATATARPDYTWLSQAILRRMEELKSYPAEARLDRMEGHVMLKAIVKSDGSVEAVQVFRSSGHESLYRAAVELLNLAAPFHFPHSLGKPQITVKIPMSYKLTP
jgi:periplasmic protein TonB